MHGANRLGGNGVANSTVFGGIAGETMAAFVTANNDGRDADEALLEAEVARATYPFTKPVGDLNRIRETLLDLMWDDVGIIRDAASLTRGHRAACGIGG